jgi:hypothetical protein
VPMNAKEPTKSAAIEPDESGLNSETNAELCRIDGEVITHGGTLWPQV